MLAWNVRRQEGSLRWVALKSKLPRMGWKVLCILRFVCENLFRVDILDIRCVNQSGAVATFNSM